MFPIAAAMLQALPSFHTDCCQKTVFISVSSDLYEKYIVTHVFCVCNHNFYGSLENGKLYILLNG